MKAEGRSVVNLSAPKSRANDPRSASKRPDGGCDQDDLAL